MKPTTLNTIHNKIETIINEINEDKLKHAPLLDNVHKAHKKSAANLLDYLSFRSHDLRNLQKKLGYLGMSRLARAEAHVLASLQTTQFYLKNLLGEEASWPKNHTISIKKSNRKLRENTKVLFGAPSPKRKQRIMVTMPAQAAEDQELIEAMIAEGMNVARINCAHDEVETWSKIIENIKACDKKLNTKTFISMDIPGPKIRTGELSKSILIREGDYLRLSKRKVKGERAVIDENGDLLTPAIISCTLPDVFNYLKVGDRVYFDDGVIMGKIHSLDEDEAIIEIEHAKKKETKLKADKGINFPDSKLAIHGLTNADREYLKFISKEADIVNFSFVNTHQDVKEIHECLKDLNALDELGIVYKIETKKAFDNLPSILLEAMKAPKVGVMIARGDLAIEAGWNEMGHIQKEMLSLCNACHIPIIWATQVLENMAKKGLPSRSEITDTVNATKSECIMLNKGPHILKAIQLLDEIIVSMERYQEKNAPILPILKKKQLRIQ